MQGAFDIADQPGCAAFGGAPLAVDHPQVVLGAEGRIGRVADEDHARAVRRPDRGVGGIAPIPDQVAHLAIQIGHPQRGEETIFVREECGSEQDLLAVGRPFRRSVAAVVIFVPGQVARFSSCGRHDKDIMHGVVKIAEAVEPIDFPCHPVGLGGKDRFRVCPRRESYMLSIRGPSRAAANTLRQIGQHTDFAAVNGNRIELLYTTAGGEEGNVAFVGRPDRVAVDGVPVCELPRFTGLRRQEPDSAELRVFGRVDMRNGVGDVLSARGELGILQELESKQVFGLQGPLGFAGHIDLFHGI